MPGNLPCMSGKPDHSPEEGTLGHDIYPVICLPRRHPKGKDLDDIESQPDNPFRDVDDDLLPGFHLEFCDEGIDVIDDQGLLCAQSCRCESMGEV